MRQYHAGTGFLEHVRGKPRNEKITGSIQVGVTLLYRQDADVPTPRPAGQLAAHINIESLASCAEADSSREKRTPAFQFDFRDRRKFVFAPTANTAELKYVSVLQEKTALLREKQTESGQVDLSCVHAGSGKVGVYSQRGGQGRR